MKKIMLWVAPAFICGCASNPPVQRTINQVPDAVIYPAFPLRTDLGEILQPNEQQDVELSAQVIEQTIMKRYQEKGQRGRGDHSTSHGCYEGDFKVKAGLPAEFAQGIAEKEATYKAVARFSNGDPPDISDFRSVSTGLAVKLDLSSDAESASRLRDGDFMNVTNQIGSREQDFLLAIGPTFMVKDIHEYSWLFARRIDPGVKEGVELAVKHPKIIFDRGVVPLTRTSSTAPQFLTERQWSRLASVWGDQAAKFSFIPCHGDVRVKKLGSRTKDPRYQSALIQEHLQKRDICYELAVQMRPNEVYPGVSDQENAELLAKHYPIEDATVRWPDLEAKLKIKTKAGEKETFAPFVTVGTLKIKQGTQAIEADRCERLAFNPWNGLKAHQPMSSLSRGRLFVYKRSEVVRRRLGPSKE